jgi:hypothetical protein
MMAVWLGFFRLSRASLLAAALALTAISSFSPAGAAGPQTAREQIGKPVEAAQQLLREKKTAEALAKLQRADAVPNKTPYEVYVIEATRAVAYLDAGDDAAAVAALDKALATGILPPAEALKRVETQVQLSYRAKNYPAVIAYAERYYREGGKDEAPRLLTAQAYYLQNDFANAAKASRALMQEQEKAGRAPSEMLLQLLVSSEYKQKNATGYIEALKRMVALYPKSQYWRDLIAAVRQRAGFSERLTLDVERLALATGVMERPAQYMEAAQRALEAGLPGDAKAFLDKGYAAGVLGQGADAERQQRLAALAARQSKEDAANLPQLAKEAEAAANGLPWVKLGEAYASFGQYERAIEAFRKGIAKGGLKYPDEAKLHLAVAAVEGKQEAAAREAARSISGNDGAGELAQLWLLHAGIR